MSTCGKTIRMHIGQYEDLLETKVTKTEMVWPGDKIGRPNQSDTSRNHRRQAKKRQAEEEVS